MSKYIKQDDLFELVRTGRLVGNNDFENVSKAVGSLPTFEVADLSEEAYEVGYTNGQMAERKKELFENLEREKKLFWAMNEIDQAVKKARKLLGVCGKSKDGLSYWWYAGTIEAVIELLEVVGYEVKKREVEE